MATTIYDVTLLQGIIGILNALVAISYLILAWFIMRNKKFLKWKKHIYPVTMLGALFIGVGLMWLAGTNYYAKLKFTGVSMWFIIFIGTAAVGYAVWQDVERLIYKFDKIEEQNREITHLKEVINQLQKSTKIIFVGASLLILSGCGSMKKEVERLKLKESSSLSEYQKKEQELTAKISEKERIEKEQKETIKLQKEQIEKLSSEKSKLSDKLNQQNKDDISISNATGTVRMTDANGNVYEIPAGAGTTINKKSESSLSRELNEIKEKAEAYRRTAIDYVNDLFTKDNTIKEKDNVIKQKDTEISDISSKNKSLAVALQKEKTREATPVFVWIFVGMLAVVALQLLWKYGSPGILKIFKE